MNVRYSINSQPIALVAPNPITRPASAHASSRPRGMSRPAPPESSAQFTK